MKPNTAQQLLESAGAFRELTDALNSGKKANLAYGMTGSLGSMLCSALQSRMQRGLLVIVGDLEQAQHWEADLSVWLPEDRVLLFPPLEVLPYEVIAHNTELLAERLGVMERLVFAEDPYAVVAPVGALFRRLVPPRVLRDQSMELLWGDEVDIEALLLRLVSTGYERVDMVETRGHFSVRGGIIDIWPASNDLPIRVELFDVEVDSIREFSPDTQRSVQNLKRIRIGPARESILEPQGIKPGLAQIRAELAQASARLEAFDHRREALRLRERVEEFIEGVRENGYHERLDAYLPYFYEELATLTEYFSEPPLVIYSDPHRLAESARERKTEWSDRHAELLSAGRLLPGQEDVYVDYDALNRALRPEQRVYLLSLLRDLEGVEPESLVGWEARQLPAYQGQWELFMEEVEQHRTGAYRTVVVSSTSQRVERVREALNERGASHIRLSPNADDLTRALPRGTCGLMEGGLRTGFVLPGARVAVLTDSGVYGRPKQPRRRFARGSDSRPVYDYEELRSGDYVVHVNHGIGKYMGLRNLEVEGTHRDYLYIKYEGEDRLYVPVDQVDKVQKYVGAEGREPRINSLGTKEWSRVKHQVKKSVRQMAEELLRLYAARESMEGHAYGADTPWQADFEQAFTYEETPDQLRAVEEIKEDMRKPQPMDRLLCGDVGYGKTEVAMRAAFKAVMEGMQVAVLVPTTILTQQHFQTFTERFAGYPVRIRQLSRFRTQKEQEQIVTELRRGDADIVVGTHRLVQGDIAFKNLGLLIIDEEHRFGVAHKERLKQFRQSVDVLTLTATPIPRTLHMALAGLRDMSVIETPPQNRFPVETFVVEYNDGLVRDAILREMHRNGQIFYVHNRVRSISYVHTKLTKLVPEARIAVAHGQMPERELEQVMMDFLERKYDVLLSTTIIESGLDIANSNTLIVEHADKLGLAQLYQLRGRVGRSERVAYAYFTYQRKKVLTEVAEKRLQAIREFTQLGAGFKLALRDLEIRGAGNILGPEQHGFIISVGFDLYTQLLDEAIKELKGEAVAPAVSPAVELTVDAYIPDEYIRDARQKISMYKRLNATTSLDEVLDAEAELLDRYGDTPQPVQNLLALSRLRILAAQVGILSISERGRELRMEFVGAAAELVERARVPLETAFGKQIRVKARPKPAVTLRERIKLGAPPQKTDPESAVKLKKIENILVTLNEIKDRSAAG